MFSAAQLVRLSEVHKPDEFNHCSCCKEPWPCLTMTIVQQIGSKWAALQKETDE